MDEDVIPILRVEDAEMAVRWYQLLGFEVQWEHRADTDAPAFLEIARGPMRLFLSERAEDASPEALIYLSVHDVDAVAAVFDMVPEHTHRAREIELRDPDGNRLRVGMPSPSL